MTQQGIDNYDQPNRTDDGLTSTKQNKNNGITNVNNVSKVFRKNRLQCRAHEWLVDLSDGHNAFKFI